MSCSLVSKAWLEPSRRLLFANASVSVDVENCQSWLDDISPTNSRLLHHVRSFTYFAERRGPPDPRYSIYTLREYLPSLYRLHTLTFRNMDIEPEISEHLYLFSAFQHTLVSLSLSQVSVAWSAFVALIGHFPNIKDLEILWVSFETDGRPIPPPARALRGRLSTDLIERTSADIFIDRFPSLRLEYEELVIFWKFEPRLLAAVEKSLKYLKFVRQIRTSPAEPDISRSEPSRFPANLDLSRCSELRQLEVCVENHRPQELMLISSIASTNFRKLVFVSRELRKLFHFVEFGWAEFDDMICGLVDRLRSSRYNHTLEVEFRTESVELGEEHYSTILPKFREKGRVEIVVEGSDRMLSMFPLLRSRRRRVGHKV